MDLGENDIQDALEPFHLLLHGATHARIGEAYRVGDVDRGARLPGQQLGEPGRKLDRQFLREERRRQRLRRIESLGTRCQRRLCVPARS